MQLISPPPTECRIIQEFGEKVWLTQATMLERFIKRLVDDGALIDEFRIEYYPGGNRQEIYYVNELLATLEVIYEGTKVTIKLTPANKQEKK